MAPGGLSKSLLMEQVTKIVLGGSLAMRRPKMRQGRVHLTHVNQDGGNIVPVQGAPGFQFNGPGHRGNRFVEQASPRVAKPKIVLEGRFFGIGFRRLTEEFQGFVQAIPAVEEPGVAKQTLKMFGIQLQGFAILFFRLHESPVMFVHPSNGQV